MKVLVDVNLSPAWVDTLRLRDHDAIHWTTVGDPRAPDPEVIAYAREHRLILFTHDLDFGVLLALTRAGGPSVLQVRTQNVLPDAIGHLVLGVLTTHRDVLETGALVTIDEASARVRLLPIR